MSKKGEGEMTFLEHLEVMRFHLIRSIAAVIILALLAFVFKEIVFDMIILAPKEPNFPPTADCAVWVKSSTFSASASTRILSPCKR